MSQFLLIVKKKQYSLFNLSVGFIDVNLACVVVFQALHRRRACPVGATNPVLCFSECCEHANTYVIISLTGALSCFQSTVGKLVITQSRMDI